MRIVSQRQAIDINNWNKGLITEASPLNFPEGSSVDEENFVINRNGSRARRYGIDYEASYALTALGETTASLTGVAIHNYIWENVNENPDSNWLVHQFGNKLYFYNSVTSNVSANSIFNGSAISLTATTVHRFSFASIQGFLVVSVGDQILRVINAESTASYSISYVSLKVRDFWGLDDGLAVDERTSGLSNLHAYNLYNQGWPAEFFCSTDPPNPKTINNGSITDPVQVTYSETGNYPSNSDILYTAMTFLTNGRKAYYPHALVNVVSGNTPAPNGHYIIDLFNRGQGRIDTYAADIAAGWPARVNYTGSIPADQSTGGVVAVAAYAGRIFYACSAGETGGDSKSPHVGTFVLFSQLVDNIDDLSKCYQEADPTAEDISDIIATDGGYIQLPNIVNIKALVPFKSVLLVFADNGVWSISGGTSGFSATEYESSYLTNNGVLSPESIVVSGEEVLYWSRSGIFIISSQTNATLTTAGTLSVQSLTRQTIQTLYNNIPYNSKKKVVGLYDEVDNRIRWLYQDTYSADFPYRFTHELILDTRIPAWYKFSIKSISTKSPYISGYINVPPIARDIASTNYKYSILGQDLSDTYVLTAGWMKDTSFLDWYTAGSGTDAAAYLVTGYVTGGDSARFKSMPWLTVHLLRERE